MAQEIAKWSFAQRKYPGNNPSVKFVNQIACSCVTSYQNFKIKPRHSTQYILYCIATCRAIFRQFVALMYIFGGHYWTRMVYPTLLLVFSCSAWVIHGRSMVCPRVSDQPGCVCQHPNGLINLTSITNTSGPR